MAEIVQFPAILTERQAAAKLGVSPDTLRRERARGNISFTKIGGRVRYLERHLIDYIEGNTTCATGSGLKSEGTSSAAARTPMRGVQPGSMAPRDKLAANRSALQTLKAQK
ncbi:helix-turn-helix domain-containing protein [Sphingobium sp. TomTYG45]